MPRMSIEEAKKKMKPWHEFILGLGWDAPNKQFPYEDLLGAWIFDYFRKEDRITFAVSEDSVQLLMCIDGQFKEVIIR